LKNKKVDFFGTKCSSYGTTTVYVVTEVIGLAGRLQSVDLRLSGDVWRLARRTADRVDVPSRQYRILRSFSVSCYFPPQFTHSSDIWTTEVRAHAS